MNNLFVCNSCDKKFLLTEDLYGKLEQDGLTVKYFSCPNCGRKYHVITTSARMMELIAQRKMLQSKIAMARKNKFREKTIKGYLDELAKVQEAQRILFAELKAKGEEILRKSKVQGGSNG